MSDDATNDELSSADSLEENNRRGKSTKSVNSTKNGADDADSDFELRFDVKGDILVKFDDVTTERSLTADSEKSSLALPNAVNGNEEFYRLAFLDGNHADCSRKITSLSEQVNDLRSREAALVKEVEILNKVVEDFQTQPPSQPYSAYNDTLGVDLSLSNVSPRSDRSVLSTHINTLGIKCALDVFRENNRLLQDGLSAEQRNEKSLRSMQSQIDDLKACLKNAEERCQQLIEEYSNKESDFMEQISRLQKNLLQTKNSIEPLLAEKRVLSEEYNKLLMQKSNWQSKIDELKNVRHCQIELETENERLCSENEDLKVQLRNAKEKINDLNVGLTSSKSMLDNKSEEIEHFRNLLNDRSKENYKHQYEEVSKKYKEIADENERLNDELIKANAKLETMSQVERAFETQNLGLSTLKKSLESKDSNLAESRKRCTDLEHVLDENLREREQKAKLVLQLQEELSKKSNEFDELRQEFNFWKANANAQFEDTCQKYEEKINGLHTILQKYTDYPGSSVQGQIDELKAGLKVSEQKCQQLTDEYSNKESDFLEKISRLEKNLLETKNSIEHLSVEKAALNENYNKILMQKSNWQSKNDDLKKVRHDQLESDKESERLWSENERLKVQLRNAQEKINDLNVGLTNAKSTLANKTEEFRSLQNNRSSETIALTEEIGHLKRKCELSDLLHIQATETVQALHDQYEEERKLNDRMSIQIENLTEDVERLRRDKINAVNEADLSAHIYKIVADRMRQLNGGGRSDVSVESLLTACGEDAASLRFRLAKMTEEKRFLQLEIYRQKSYRRSLMCQKKYLLSIIDNFKSTESNALNFLKKNGFSKVDGNTSRHDATATVLPVSKMRRCVAVVIAVIRLRKKIEKIRRYIDNHPALSPYPLSVSL